MTREELIEIVKNECPAMLERGDFMHDLIVAYSDDNRSKKELAKKMQLLSDDEYENWCKLRDTLGTATVGQAIKYLQENFKPYDKLCYMDCVEGCKNDCTYVTKDQLGTRFFYYVGDMKKRAMERRGTDDASESAMFPYVADNDVVVC